MITKGKVELSPSELSNLPSDVGCFPHLSQLYLDKVTGWHLFFSRFTSGPFPQVPSLSKWKPCILFQNCAKCQNGLV